MSAPLLLTKFNIPPSRENRIPRPRLLDQLELSPRRKLILVSAPAGFGKTTLLSEWGNHIKTDSRIRLCWLSLDSGDNEPRRFWAYFIRVLQSGFHQLGIDLLETFESAEHIDIENILTILLNEIAALDEHLILVLDDFQLIESPSIHQGMIFLLDHLPSRFHLVLATRVDPPWPLARIRAQQSMLELRQNDLRFTPEETTCFLNEALDIDLEPGDVFALEARTEGWIAGLQMAAISLQKHPDPREFITAFSASNRYIFDYLIEEIWHKQPTVIQDFLLRTSILDHFTAPLCNTLLDRQDSQEILGILERANLFLVPLDDQRCWFRYHHLFGQLLQNRCRQAGIDCTHLHRKASLWLEKNDLLADALFHAIRCGDFERAAQIAEDRALMMLDQGNLQTLTSWLESLPAEINQNRPWLCVTQGWLTIYAGELAASEEWLTCAEQQIQARTPRWDAGESRHLRGQIAAIRSYIAGLSGDHRRMNALAQQALADLPDGDRVGRAMAYTMLGLALRQAGRLAEAEAALKQANKAGETPKNNQVNLLAQCNLAGIYVWRGQLKQAVQDYLRIIQSAKAGKFTSPMIGSAYLALSRIYREQNKLDKAMQSAQKGLAISEQWGHREYIASGYIDLAEVQLALGNHQAALKNMAHARQRIGELIWPTWLQALEIKMLLVTGNLVKAVEWARVFEAQREKVELNSSNVAIYASLARVWMAEDKWLEASELLQHATGVINLTEVLGRRLEAAVLHALACQGAGKPNQAITILEAALILAEPEGFVRVFIDEGIAARGLLQAVPSHSPARKYAHFLCTEFERTEAGHYLNYPVDLPEPLSERELEVLRLLDTSMNSQEIADHLVISVSTVRTHIRNIYAKLGVSRRMEVIQRGKELGLL